MCVYVCEREGRRFVLPFIFCFILEREGNSERGRRERGREGKEVDR